jgi:hypothetical protein
MCLNSCSSFILRDASARGWWAHRLNIALFPFTASFFFLGCRARSSVPHKPPPYLEGCD